MEKNREPRIDTNMVNLFLAKEQKEYNRGKVAFSTNCAGTSRHSYDPYAFPTPAPSPQKRI